MGSWSFLTHHGRVLVCVAHDPGIRLREIAAEVGITERSAFAIVSDLAEAGYVVKRRDGRRNRYEVQAHRPLPDAVAPPTIGQILDLLVDTDRRDTRSADESRDTTHRPHDQQPRSGEHQHQQSPSPSHRQPLTPVRNGVPGPRTSDPPALPSRPEDPRGRRPEPGTTTAGPVKRRR